MAELTLAQPGLGSRLREVLEHGFRQLGMNATVETEMVPNLDLLRIHVVAPEFENLWYSERQELAWRILDQEFTKDELFAVSGIYTSTPDEQSGAA